MNSWKHWTNNGLSIKWDTYNLEMKIDLLILSFEHMSSEMQIIISQNIHTLILKISNTCMWPQIPKVQKAVHCTVFAHALGH